MHNQININAPARWGFQPWNSMKTKEEIVFELEQEDRIYRFSMPKSAPVGEIYDICFKVLQRAVNLAQTSIQSAQKELTNPTPNETEEGV